MTIPATPLQAYLYNLKEIENVHATRLTKYAEKHFNGQEHIAVDFLIKVHRKRLNVAMYISESIGESHEDYMRKLKELGECDEFIR